MTQANRITDHPDPVVAAYIGRDGRDRGISYQQFKELYDAFNDTIREVGRKNQRHGHRPGPGSAPRQKIPV